LQAETSERAEAQAFWNEFFEVFGVNRKRTGLRFEKAAERFGKRGKGHIDVFWPGTLLAEHKSVDQDLDAAHTQARGYFDGLSESELPRYVIVADFQRFRPYDLEENTTTEFKLSELPSHIPRFGFIAGYTKIKARDEDPLNIKAVQLLGELHDMLKQDGYGLDENGKAGHALQLFLVRVLFCLFADDTGLFSPKNSFLALVERTREDGADTGTFTPEAISGAKHPAGEAPEIDRIRVWALSLYQRPPLRGTAGLQSEKPDMRCSFGNGGRGSDQPVRERRREKRK
jgi:hypothetical protein